MVISPKTKGQEPWRSQANLSSVCLRLWRRGSRKRSHQERIRAAGQRFATRGQRVTGSCANCNNWFYWHLVAMGTIKHEMQYELGTASDAGRKASLSQIGFLPIMHGREGDGIFIKNSYLGQQLPGDR